MGEAGGGSGRLLEWERQVVEVVGCYSGRGRWCKW